jgi:hypothetical protein
MTPITSTRLLAGTIMAIALVTLVLAAAPAWAVAPPVTVTLEPVPAGRTTATAVERVANGPGNADTWILNANVLVRNNSASAITWTRSELSTAGQTKIQIFSVQVPANSSRRVQVSSSFTGSYPLGSVTGKFNFTGFDQALRTFTLADIKHQAPAGAYYLPYKKSDMPAGTFWTNFETQTDQSHHYGDPAQAFAYDLFVVRWNGSTWTQLKSGTTGSSNSDFLAYNLPIYAPDDGTMLECRYSLPNLTPGTKDPNHRFGNSIWLRTGSGEVMAFAHIKQNSIPLSLCPTQSKSKFDNGGTAIHAQPVQVKAGQFIGRVGNSGNTSGPHTHIQLDRNAPADVDDANSLSMPALPLEFHRFQATANRNSTPGPSPSLQTIGDASAHALPPYGLFLPNSPCSWLIVGPGAPEASAANMSTTCFQSQFNDLVRQGYLPTNLDGMKVGSATAFNIVARPNRPATVAYANMSASTFQSRFDSLKQQGYRLIDIDNYLVGSSVVYAGVWAKEGGPGQAVYHGASQATHNSNFQTLTAQGFRPQVVSATNSANGLIYSAIYELSGAGGFVTEVTPEANFQNQFNLRTGQGLRPVDVDGLTIGTTAYLSVTWDNLASTNYVMHNAMTFSVWASTFQQQNAAGRLTDSLTGYQSGTNARYAAIWRLP